jgi:hypothetical protein
VTAGLELRAVDDGDVAQDPLPLAAAAGGSDRVARLAAPRPPVWIAGVADLSVRYWVSRLGWVGALPANRADATTLPLALPAGFDASTATYRVQFLDGERPVTPVSMPGALAIAPPTGLLENPGEGDDVSGIGVVSGWVCGAGRVTYRVDGGEPKDAAHGTSRSDTTPLCGRADNGFGALVNWNLLGDGEHTIEVLADGALLARRRFHVTTLGTPFLRGVSAEYRLTDFPIPGRSASLRWQEASQNFVISGTDAGVVHGGDAALSSAPTGLLEIPDPGSHQSGIGVLSGWVCDASSVTVSIDGGPPRQTAYGTSRADSTPVCGDGDNGFGILINWNLLGDGSHTAVAFADGVPFSQSTFSVTTLGTTFLSGVAAEYTLLDFAGRNVVVRWQEAQQNFVIVATD